MDIVGIKRFLNKNKDKTLDEIISESVVNGIGNVIGNSGSPAGTDTLFGLLKRGMVKSVQILKFSSSEAKTSDPVYGDAVESTISATNMSKTIVFATARTPMGSDSNHYSVSAYQSATDKIRTSYTRQGRTTGSGKYYVENAVVYVVEFY